MTDKPYKFRAETDACSRNLISFCIMYAIVEIAGQQFKVEAGAEIFVNRLASKKDETVEFDKVLLLDNEGAARRISFCVNVA